MLADLGASDAGYHMPSPDTSQNVLAGLKPAAIMLGVAVDWVLTIFFSILTVNMVVTAADRADEKAFEAALDALTSDSGYLMMMLLSGAFFTAAGAYAGARRAGVVPLKHGLAVAAVSASAAVLFQMTSEHDATQQALPIWYTLGSWLLILPAGILGGYYAREHGRAG